MRHFPEDMSFEMELVELDDEERASAWLAALATCPAVSTIRCSPVKKGWHAEQTSVRISSTVEPVVQVLPQLHITVALG